MKNLQLQLGSLPILEFLGLRRKPIAGNYIGKGVPPNDLYSKAIYHLAYNCREPGELQTA